MFGIQLTYPPGIISSRKHASKQQNSNHNCKFNMTIVQDNALNCVNFATVLVETVFLEPSHFLLVLVDLNFHN